jgi:hypothetical protein
MNGRRFVEFILINGILGGKQSLSWQKSALAKETLHFVEVNPRGDFSRQAGETLNLFQSSTNG